MQSPANNEATQSVGGGGHSSGGGAAQGARGILQGGLEAGTSYPQRLSVVLPCYNEELSLPHLIERLSSAAACWGYEYEVLLVDDGSTDGTWELICEQSRRDPRWKGIRLGRNFGQQVAIRAGLELATGDAAVILDADLQDPPETVGEMLRLWRQGHEVVVGVRQSRQERMLKQAAYRGFYRVLSALAEKQIPLDAGDFCVLDRRAIDVIRMMPESRPFLRGLRSWMGFRQAYFPYDRPARQHGSSHYPWRRLGRLALDGIFGNSHLPLHLATALGLVVSAVAVVGAVAVFLVGMFPEFMTRHFGIRYVSGTASVILAVLLMGGTQLFCLGIIGAYIGRIHENVMRRPLWTTLDTVGELPRHVATPARASSPRPDG